MNGRPDCIIFDDIFYEDRMTPGQIALLKQWYEGTLFMREQDVNKTNRTLLLEEADDIVNKDRNNTYGPPEDNFKDIAALWAAYKGVEFSSMDVVVMNILIKVARLKKTPGYRDGLVDIAGYAACGADIQAFLRKQLGGIDIKDTIPPAPAIIYPPGIFTSSARHYRFRYKGRLYALTKDEYDNLSVELPPNWVAAYDLKIGESAADEKG